MLDARTTVVIATRNRGPELEKTIEEICGLDPAPPVIVLDNASEDDTAPRLLALAERHRQVSGFRLPVNRGTAVRNLGVVAARTPYAAFCDDDSTWEPGALQRAADLLDDHPRLGLVAARTLVGEEGAEDPMNAALADSALGTPPDLPGPAVLGFLACAAVVRRKAFLEVGGFSEVLRFIGEERLLAMDLAASGWAACYAETVTARHRPSEHRPPSPWRRARELRNDALTAWMRRPVGVAARETRALAKRAVRDRQAAKAMAELAARFPVALAQRRRLPEAIEAQAAALEAARGRA
ncbi:glycosyltransferase family 2 protein [Glycomyces sp. TRM65418]|uniref:glycosyltransferase family 2 protein n=1 Tax=Glycomyces sp. TRM65418 TaxID=2867006 RepID=UPI001CE6B29A|nr:glycosyltransferase family A protein [Glycomyces sp. TRM65418]MCC3761865.1 glycosyltransferase family 2 protein [Glycomyces sp. TRM65418]QZD55946.1 glycosyltransferase family 2 protein [Glycomyces sp. TRM65418]